MFRTLSTLLGAPSPDRGRTVPLSDRVLVAVLVPAVIAEGLLRDDITERALGIAITLWCVAWIALRRTRPLAATLGAFGLASLATASEMAFGVGQVDMGTGAVMLLLPYSLLRWGSGREVAIGSVVILGTFVLSLLNGEMKDVAEVIGAAVVLSFPGALGASVRFRAQTIERDIEHARSRERERLARDLHDTVAHHVSAIAIQAQAAQAIFHTRPEAARDALTAIESEAARSLVELRSLVTTLREGEAAELAPQAGIGDIEGLARPLGEAPAVVVELHGELGGVTPVVQATLFRLAQESITNALRHAERASRVLVRVSGEPELVRLTVEDDGQGGSGAQGGGYGLLGMAERAALLGGSLKAGQRPGGGFKVEALLPRHGGG